MSDEKSQNEVRYCPWDEAEAKKTDHKPDVNKETVYYQCTKCGRAFLIKEWPKEATISSQNIERVVEICSIDSKDHGTYPLKNGLCFYVDSEGKLSANNDIGDKKPIAKVYKHSDEWWIVDLGCPQKGIRINNKKVIHNAKLNWNDKISFSWEDNDNKSSGKPEIAFRVTLTANGFELVESFDEEKPICIKVNNISSEAAGRTILKDISVYAKSGDFIGILGPSGCGKSSLIQRIVGLAPIDKGSIKINENELSDCKNQFLSICAYVPQQTTLHESLTILEECENFAQMNLRDSTSVEKSIDYILRLVGLVEERDKEIRVLSGGQKKRLGIALELLREPRVLLLDEPSSGLDPASETKIMKYLRSIADQGRVVLCATHTMDNVDEFDKVLFLSKGEEIYFGSPKGAKKHFGVDSYQNIYNNLEEDPDDPQSQTTKSFQDSFSNSPEKKELDNSLTLVDSKSKLPTSTGTANQFSQIWAYVHRSWLYFKHHKLDWGIQSIIQPILIAFVIKLACAGKFFGDPSMEDALFFCLISMFWLGMNNSVRELVSQRYPGRCLERLEQVSLSVYLFSKWAWMLFICFIQTLAFSIILYLPLFQPDESSLSQIVWSWDLAIPSVLFVISIVGYLIGLAVSAFSKSQTSAVAMLPIIVIPVILLSKPVTNIDYPSEPVFTHIFIVAGFVVLTGLLIVPLAIAGRFLKRPNILTSWAFMALLAGVFVSYLGLLTYNNLLDKPADKSQQKYNVLAEKFQMLSPCYMPLKIISLENQYEFANHNLIKAERKLKTNIDEQQKKQLEQDKSSNSTLKNDLIEEIGRNKPYYYISLLAYAALCVTLTIVFQNAREKEWEGR